MDEGDAGLLQPVAKPIIPCGLRIASAPGHRFVEKFSEKALARATVPDLYEESLVSAK